MTDTLISGKGPSSNDPPPHIKGDPAAAIAAPRHQHHHLQGGPLLDFKSAFSAGLHGPDQENSSGGQQQQQQKGDFLQQHDPTLSGHMTPEDIHRTLQANLPHPPHAQHHGSSNSQHHNNNHLHHGVQQHHGGKCINYTVVYIVEVYCLLISFQCIQFPQSNTRFILWI